jgi:hypothetical protein
MDISVVENVTKPEEIRTEILSEVLARVLSKETFECAWATIIGGIQIGSTNIHEYAHQLIGRGQRLFISFDGYYDNLSNFKLANQISYCPYLENRLLQIFEQLGIQDTQSIERTNTEVFYGLSRNVFLDNCCVDRIDEAIQALYKALYLKERANTLLSKLVEQIVEYILEINYFIAFLRKLTAEAIRFQFLAFLIHSRLSRSPTPQKKEPPVGGVKIGGKLLLSVMLPRILYANRS